MATKIITKSGSGVPSAGALDTAELAVDLTNKRIYTKDSGGTVIELGTNGGSSTFENLTVTGDLAVDTNTLFVDASENKVGIGTDSPSEELDITGDGSNVRLRMYDGAGASVARFEHSGANLDIANVATGTATMTFTTGTGSGTPKMTIDASGNVGIGDNNPQSKLSVSGGAIHTDRSLGSTQNHLEFGSATTNTFGHIGLTQSNANLYFGSDLVQQAMVINRANGNVGIGTTSPSSKLEIAGTSGAAVKLSLLSAGVERHQIIQGGSGDGGLQFYNQTAGAERMRIDSSGNVGIGATTVNALLHLKDNDPVIRFEDDEGGAARTYEAGSVGGNFVVKNINQATQPLTILDSGNVGIGTDAPSGKLDVELGATGTIAEFRGADNDLLQVNSENNLIALDVRNTSNGLDFQIQGVSKARLDASGNLLVGKTTGNYATEGAQIENNGTAAFTRSGFYPLLVNRKTSGSGMVQFYIDNVASGQITTTSGGTPAFASGSDIRLKDNVTDHESELSNVMALRPVRWDWKHIEGASGEGFIAQELEQTAWADLVSEGDDGYKQVAGLGTVETRLIKAIQEQQAMIEELKAEVAALKGA
jgi:hypothetical protein